MERPQERLQTQAQVAVHSGAEYRMCPFLKLALCDSVQGEETGGFR
jgi:hypothetical protein